MAGLRRPAPAHRQSRPERRPGQSGLTTDQPACPAPRCPTSRDPDPGRGFVCRRPPGLTTPGAVFAIVINAKDQFGNAATSFTGLVTLSYQGQTLTAAPASTAINPAPTIQLTNGTATLASAAQCGSGQIVYLQGSNLVQAGQDVLASGVSAIAPGSSGVLYYLQGSNLVQLGQGVLVSGVSVKSTTWPPTPSTAPFRVRTAICPPSPSPRSQSRTCSTSSKIY